MKMIILTTTLLILISCSHKKTKNTSKHDADLVTVRTALEQAQMSYLKGCVDAFRSLGMAASFVSCREKAISHRIELDGIMAQEPLPETPTAD